MGAEAVHELLKSMDLPLGGRQGPRGHGEHELRDQDQAPVEAAEAHRGLHGVRQQAGVDGAHRIAGAAARSAAAGAARRRPFRDIRFERSVSPRHQPQQPPAAAAGAQCAGHHRAQRKAHAAGGGGCAARQRPARPCDHRHQQAPAQVPGRHDQGQAGPLPPEPARQARRLLRPFGHRGGPDAASASVRIAEEDGARTVQAVHLLQAAAARRGLDHQGGEAPGGARGTGGVGHPRRGDPRASRAPEPRADLAPPRHPGLRARADRGQGHPAASARLHGVQRRLRRRPDGRARAAVHRGAARGARLDDVVQQHSLARQRRSDHRALAGRGARAVLHDARARGRQGRRHGIQRRRRSASRLREPQHRSAGEDQGAPVRARARCQGTAGAEHPRGRHHGGPRAAVRDPAARVCPSMPSTRT